MKFSDTTNKDGIIQQAEGYLGLQDGAISGNATLLKIITAFANSAYNLIVAWILEAQAHWEWDDTNYTDFPIGTTTLEIGTGDYELPAATSGGNLATLLRVTTVSVKDANGDYVKLDPLSEQQLENDLETLFDTNGMPKWYREVGNSVELWPKPASGYVTTAAGLKVQFQRAPDQFTSSDTTQQPGFALPFHRLIPLIIARDYGAPRGLGRQDAIATDIETGKRDLQIHYSNKNADVPRRIGRRYSSGA